MNARPYFRCSFNEIFDTYRASNGDLEVLISLRHELQHRKSPKSSALRQKIEAAILDLESSPANNEETAEEQVEKKAVVFKPEQRAVIELDEGESRIVDAGPGAGKTAVACARVASLIEDKGLEASKIFLISFTRTAVKELRDRIESFAADPINVSGLQIFTLDSFTWQVLRGFGDDKSAELMGSYEHNIRQFICQLKEGDDQLLDYLSELEHVIIDEGQDLVGDRADLVVELIKRLEPHCGVTVFADSAQAIYGFTTDSGQRDKDRSLSVVDRILKGELNGFERKVLNGIHRTDDPRLVAFYRAGRERLINKSESDLEDWKAMKQLVINCSHGEVGPVDAQNLSGKSDHLVLFRTRAEVVMASSFLWEKGVAHRLRMSGIQLRLHPWLGRMFADCINDHIGRDEFASLWKQKVGTSNEERDRSWSLLLDHAGEQDERVRLPRLREVLSRDRPPIDFLVDEGELPGPVLGTIHASKGREAMQVNLMLPPDEFINAPPPYAKTPEEIAEEERVLFVGATRARKTLMVGKGQKTYASTLDSGRIFKKPRTDNWSRLVELGLKDDLDRASIADGRLGEGTSERQEWLWKNRATALLAEARFNPELNAYVLFEKNTNRAICQLSKSFSSDMWNLARRVASKEQTAALKPAQRINFFRQVGVTTVVVPEAFRDSLLSPWRHSGFLLAPVLTGFTKIRFSSWDRTYNVR